MTKAPPAKTPAKDKRKALGRGLGALLPNTPASAKRGLGGDSKANPIGDKRSYFKAQVEDIYPSPEQPRRRFDEALLEELAQSIREHGVIQPLIVRERKEGGYYLIAGERRWRASQRAALLEIPIVVQNVSSQESFERAIVENVQRADLNAIEEAMAFQRLADEFKLTQEQIATKVGKERSTVANSLRLLKLPSSVREMVEENRIGMGHARALLGTPNTPTEIETCARAVVDWWAFGSSNRGANSQTASVATQSRKGPPAKKSASVRDVENRLTKSLGAQVSLAERKNGKGGCIEIKYADLG